MRTLAAKFSRIIRKLHQYHHAESIWGIHDDEGLTDLTIADLDTAVEVLLYAVPLDMDFVRILRIETVNHHTRCTDPFVCVDEQGTGDYHGCIYHMLQAAAAARREMPA